MEHDPTNAVLVRRIDLTDLLSIVFVSPDTGRVPPFTPGQFVRLGLPRPPQPGDRPGRIRYTRRAYSIASSPLVTDAMEFFVVRVEEGALTPRLWELNAGDRLWMDTVAKGEFTLDDVPAGKDLVMVATGTGVAPFISMLRTYRGRERWRRFVLIHGARLASDLAYSEEVAAIARDDRTVTYIPLATREPEGSAWRGLRGRVHVALEPERYASLVGAPLDPAECHVFLCGNPDMIDTVEATLRERGFTTGGKEAGGNIHFERYW